MTLSNRLNKLRVAVLGTGNIGTDLLIKILKNNLLACSLFAGRNLKSKGMLRAKELGVNTSDKSINAIQENADKIDLVFDATSAAQHFINAPILKNMGLCVIDLTPSHLGKPIIPSINVNEISESENINMVSCGGQASIPLIHAISQVQPHLSYIEVVSTISSYSAGPATRDNIDDYILNTEHALRLFSGCNNTKAILILNPAIPCIDMQITITLKISNPNMTLINKSIAEIQSEVKQYVTGYEVITPAKKIGDYISITLKVRGQGDYLPNYAGNLDIINCAAISAAEQYAHYFFEKKRPRCQVY